MSEAREITDAAFEIVDAYTKINSAMLEYCKKNHCGMPANIEIVNAILVVALQAKLAK